MRVVAYCRVSTDHEDQLHSLEAQKTYFTDYINKNVAWELVRIYADEGITGTSIKKRKAFKQMLVDAEEKKFDLILTKEVSRFARNTLDSILYTRKLMGLGIGVVFTNDNIDTRESDAEFKLTIMASMAQEESRKTSNRVRWGMTRTMESGYALGNHVFGYHIQKGKLTVNEDEANVVRLIFELYLSGMGCNQIGKELEKRAIVSPSGLTCWKNVSIQRILQNEKYVGTLKQKKEITIDFLAHKKVANDGREPFITFENHHEAIIEKEMFEAVQQEMERRSRLASKGKKHSNRYAFSTRLICGECGATYRRKYWNGKHEQKNAVWQCSNNIRYGRRKPSPYNPSDTIGCDSKGIHETVLQQTFLEALSLIKENSNAIHTELLNALRKALEQTEDKSKDIERVQTEMQKIKHRKTKLIELFADGAITRQDFDSSNATYTEKLNAFTRELLELTEQNANRENLEEKLSDFNMILLPLVECSVFSDCVCEQVLTKAVIHSRESIDFFLSKNGKETDYFIPLSIRSQGQRELQVLLELV